jgi:hypothetical protein
VFILRKDCKTRVFENRVLRGVFGFKVVTEHEDGESYVMMRFIIFIRREILLMLTKYGR